MTRPLGRILIADPHHVVRLGIRVLIDDLDYCRVVAEAEDGRQALEIALEEKPSMAIIGLALPQLNGVELARQLRRHSPQTEILVYTYRQGEKAIVEALRAGVKGFVLKSEPASKLVAAVEALSDRRPYFSARVSEVLLDRFLKSPGSQLFDSLTHREREIVQLVAEGHLNRQICDELEVSIKTVESLRASAMQKLSLRNTAELVRYAIRNEIVQA